MQRVVDLCYNKPLYYSWWEPKHKQRYDKTDGQCCLWHLLGPEKKDGKFMPMLPYQKLLYKTLQEHKCIWLKKSRGLGVTTFMLYYIAYLCLTRLQPGDRVCIVVGPRLDLAQDLLARFKNLFNKVSPGLFDRSSSTVAVLNKVKVEVFPSHHIDTMRGLDRVRFILSDETGLLSTISAEGT